MKATLIYKDRKQIDETSFVELMVWQTPDPVLPSIHEYKYSLALIADGRWVIGFDNERGKSDHAHRGEKEAPYAFVSVARLIDDFSRGSRHGKNTDNYRNDSHIFNIQKH
jgi:hypothetical protein